MKSGYKSVSFPRAEQGSHTDCIFAGKTTRLLALTEFWRGVLHADDALQNAPFDELLSCAAE
jgi:hypothetical protein